MEAKKKNDKSALIESMEVSLLNSTKFKEDLTVENAKKALLNDFDGIVIKNDKFPLKIEIDGYKLYVLNDATIEEYLYVTDDLLLFYDAENNTGIGHDSTATTWKDISGNHHDATLHEFNNTEQSGWHSNYLAFDGINDYVTGSLVTDGEITVEFICKINDANSNMSVAYILNHWDISSVLPSAMLWYQNGYTHSCFLVPKGEYSSYREQPLYSPTNPKNINSYVFTKKSDIITRYDNAKQVSKYTDMTFIDRFNISTIDFTIGRWHNLIAYHSNQNVYAMRIYNRALTEEEILQNYEKDKSRFFIEK